ncbi:MFS transporter [Clostridiaceae bacterium M8S5]|nr:MFS transporter [Clostridiaceae bacterium M8S5]
MKEDRNIKVCRPSYRWVNLLMIVPIIIATETIWLTLAPISSLAKNFYGVTDLSISLFAMSYMIMYILFCIPASWVVDKFGYRYSLIIGGSITAIFSLTRAVFADNFMIAIISQFLIAIGQPFIINISTKVSSNWFPIDERATATGILTMAQYLGFVVPMIISPIVAENYGVPRVFMITAIISIISAIISVIFTKERPEIIMDQDTQKDDISIKALKKLFVNKSYLLVLFICFISMGVFNTLLTLIEKILVPRGITSIQAGVVGAVFIVSGIVGAVILPIISDKSGLRVKILVIVISALVPLYLGLTYVSSFIFICVIASVAGFAIMGAAPILFQYGSEVAYPIREGTSLGLILLMGQISGVLFVYLFELLSTSKSVTFPMILIVIITAIEIPFARGMKESQLIDKGH